jgi:hypothetical protein
VRHNSQIIYGAVTETYYIITLHRQSIQC